MNVILEVAVYKKNPNDPSNDIYVGTVNVEIAGNNPAVNDVVSRLNDTYGENNVN